MKNKIIIVLLSFLFCSFISIHADEMPPLPFVDKDACPFECCQYGDWVSIQEFKAYKEPKNDSTIVYVINEGEKVEALTGIVITYKVGVTKILKPIKLGYIPETKGSLDLKPGEILYPLHYAGEGTDLFWYKGKTYYDGIAADEPDPDPPPSNLSVQVISRPVSDWWVKVKNKNGKIGWIKNPYHFDGSDGCS